MESISSLTLDSQPSFPHITQGYYVAGLNDEQTGCQGAAMSTYAKMRERRDNWRQKTAETKAKLRYQRGENKRIKGARYRYKAALRKAEAELNELKQQKNRRLVCDKTSLVFLALQLFVVARIGFRAISRVLAVFTPQLGWVKTPCTQTIINWVIRLSIARMKDGMSPVHAGTPVLSGGFILLLDASIGLGKGKILTVLALDARHHWLNPGAPSLQQVRCLAVAVADTWTGETIADLLQKLIAKLGRPVAYLKDGGTDLGKAVRLLGEQGYSSVSIDDISHCVANLLKHEFQKHPVFDVFIRASGAVSKLFKQTILACLAPPKVSTKARFMNLHRLVKWAAVLLMQSPRGRAAKGSLLQKLRDSLDQLPQCRRFINDFLLNAEPLIECQKRLKTKGLNQQSYDECRPVLATIPSPYIRISFMVWLNKHLTIAPTLGLNEMGLPISSDSIESLFGVAKHHGTGEIKDANRIALRIPALCGELTRQDAENVLKISVKEQQQWIGSLPSLISQRREVLSHSGCLENINNVGQQNLTLIAGSKSAQKHSDNHCKTVCYANGRDP